MTDLLIKALRGENTNSRPPIWLMRQAGRYMPQYQALRKKFSLLSMFRSPELIAEVTLLPIKQLGADAAILYTDILIVLDMLKVEWDVKSGTGPIIKNPLSTAEDISLLSPHSAAESLPFLKEGMKLLLPELQVPLIGFCGAPFTIASYLIEGGSSKDFKKTKNWLMRDPASFHRLLEIITEAVSDLINFQIEAGARVIQIFDSWANVLGPLHFQECSLRYMQHIMNKRKDPSVPVILFCRGSSIFASDLISIQPHAIGLDWNCDITRMRKYIPANIALQGNMDPSYLFAERTSIKKEADRILNGMRSDPAFIFNLGHGVLPDTPYENVQFLFDHVRSLETK